MSLPVAVSVYFLLPDYPHNTTAWYITEADKQMALDRAANNGRVNVTGKLNLALVKRMFGNWRWYVLVAMYIFVSLSTSSKIGGISPYSKNSDHAVWELLSGEQLLCHLSQIERLLGNSAKCHPSVCQSRFDGHRFRLGIFQ